MNDSGIQVANLTKVYRKGHVRALDNVSLHIRSGEVFGVIGPNGAGKTTFLGCLLGLLRPTSGSITIDGYLPDDLAIRSVTGYLPERLTFDRWMTGLDFLLYHHRLAGLPHATAKTDTETVLGRVGLHDAARKRIRRYSRGMLQRIGFAQALLGKPRYLFLDEPASGVDPVGVMEFRRILAELKTSGVTVVLNSHQLEQVERVCDRVAYVTSGRVDAIETVAAGAEAKRTLRVRWATVSSQTLNLQTAISEAVAESDAALIEIKPPEALFQVQGDAMAASLIRLLTQKEVPVIEATPEQGRLERLFLQDGGRA